MENNKKSKILDIFTRYHEAYKEYDDFVFTDEKVHDITSADVAPEEKEFLVISKKKRNDMEQNMLDIIQEFEQAEKESSLANEELELNQKELRLALEEASVAQAQAMVAKTQVERANQLVAEQNKKLAEYAKHLEADNAEKDEFILKSKKSDQQHQLRTWAIWIIAGVLFMFFFGSYVQIMIMTAISNLYGGDVPDKIYVILDKIIGDRGAHDLALIVVGGLLAFVTQNAVKHKTEDTVQQAYIKEDGSVGTKEMTVTREINAGYDPNPPSLDSNKTDPDVDVSEEI